MAEGTADRAAPSTPAGAPPDRRPARIAALAVLAVLVALPWIAEAAGAPFWIDIATRALIFALAAVSLDLILGYGGMVSFGHAAFVGVGAYAVGVAFTHDFEGSTLFGLPGSVNAWVVWPAAAVAGGLVAAAVGAICLRTRGVYFIMITLAFAQMIYFLVTALRRYGGDDGIALWGRSEIGFGLDLNDDRTFYFLCLALFAGFLWLARRMVRSRFGRILRGAKDNERRMRALGHPVYRYKLVAFAIAGAAAGLSGALLANATEYVGPAYLHWSRSGELIVMVVLGGMGTLIGPAIGAAALILMEEWLPEAMNALQPGLGEHWQIVLGPILILVVLYAPRGLWGLVAGRRAGGGGRPTPLAGLLGGEGPDGKARRDD
ncbi:MAG: branched-chain amino acid ABC transporter permease [Azospirillaceae bacterium]